MFTRRYGMAIAWISALLFGSPLDAATTVWDFSSSLNASSGYAVMSYRDAATQSGTSFGTTNGSTVPNIEGQQASYMSFPLSGNTGGFSVNRPYSSPTLSAYTFACDVLVPTSDFGAYSYMGLFNTTPGGTDDAELYVDLRSAYEGRLFADRDSDNGKVYTPTGVIDRNSWHRIVWAYDENHATQDVRIFVDGVKVGSSDAAFGHPCLGLPDFFPVLQDGGPQTDHAPGLVASMALVDHAMTDAEIIAMGGPKANGFASIYDPGDPPTPPDPPGPVTGFTVAFFPDTQNEVESMPAMLQSQVDWLINNQTSRKIAYVGHLGDITDNGTTTEFVRAHNIIFQLNNVNGLPWGTCAGNHDTNTSAKAALYDQYFGPTNFTGKEWYGATTSTQSSYQVFYAKGRSYLVLNLRYAADSTVRTWAQGVINAHPGMPTILATHLYFTPDGAYDPYATTLWDGLIDDNSQIFMVLCGHHDSQGPKFNSRTNAAGQIVYELMTDYQQTDYGGGYLRLLEFDEENSVIHATAYSPYYDLYHDIYPYDTFDMAMDFDARLGAAAVPGDTNGDGKVDSADAQTLASHWNTHVTIGDFTKGDFNDDGLVDATDASILAANWGHGVSEAGTAPEPSAVLLLAVGSAWLLAIPHRRRAVCRNR